MDVPANPATTWMIECDGRQLALLELVEEWDQWTRYRATCGSLTEEELIAGLDADPRDTLWFLRNCTNGTLRWTGEMLVWWDKPTQSVLIKEQCRYVTRVAGTFLQRLWRRFRSRPVPTIPLQRAPLFPGPCSIPMRRILKELRSDDADEIAIALCFLLGATRKRDAPWASKEFGRHARHTDVYIRCLALDGFGELARVHGFVDRDETPQVLAMAVEDQHIKVRDSARRSLDNIARFADGA